MYNSKPIVAVVDDDQRMLQSLEDLLESAGHCVLAFASAQTLLDSSSLPEVDCLITDIGMPGMDGFELERLMGERRPEVPVTPIAPPNDAPIAAPTAAISSSAWNVVTP